MIEPLNQLHSSSEKFLLGDSLPCPSLQYFVDSIAFLAAKFVVRDVRIVNNLGDDRHFVIANPKILLQGLEGAIVAAVSEPILLEHIEWYGSARYAFFRREDKPRLRIYIAPTEPRRRAPVHTGTRSRHPRSPLEISRINRRRSRRPACRTSPI